MSHSVTEFKKTKPSLLDGMIEVRPNICNINLKKSELHLCPYQAIHIRAEMINPLIRQQKMNQQLFCLQTKKL